MDCIAQIITRKSLYLYLFSHKDFPLERLERRRMETFAGTCFSAVNTQRFVTEAVNMKLSTWVLWELLSLSGCLLPQLGAQTSASARQSHFLFSL